MSKVLLSMTMTMGSVVEPEPDFLAGARAGEKGSGSGLLLFGLGVLWWQSRQFLYNLVTFRQFIHTLKEKIGTGTLKKKLNY